MPKQIADSVVVITGASSGIGRATARRFAERRANVVLAARRERLLDEVAAECERAGGEALAVPTDVTDFDQVQALADRAVERFGRIDTWFNNAGVYTVGRFGEIPDDVFRRTVEVDLFGVVHGCRAVLPHFLQRRSGILVNNASMLSAVAAPYVSPYAAGKWAVRGLSMSLREELVDHDDIHVCTLMPSSIDTPIFQHAANYSGRAIKALAPVYDPADVAEAVVGLAESPQREVVVGGAGKATALQFRMAPGLTERAVRLQVDKTHFADGTEPLTSGNLFEPVEEGSGESGRWLRDGGNRLGRSGAAQEERARIAAERPA